MRLPQDTFQKIKNYIHAFQSIILFLAVVLTIAVFTRNGQSDGRLGWYFGLCWLTIPILIYLVMVPMWSRAQRFSNIYAFATIDGLSVVLWLSAWASMASYVAGGKGKGGSKDATGCDNFKYGSPGRCKLSTGVTILGVFMMLTFCATASISVRAVMNYKRNGAMPDQSMGKPDFAVQTQDAFSSNMQNEELDDGQQYDPRQGGNHAYQQQPRDEEYALIYQNDHDDLGQTPHQPMSPLGQHGLGLGPAHYDQDTSYHGSNIAPDHPPPRYEQQGAYGR